MEVHKEKTTRLTRKITVPQEQKNELFHSVTNLREYVLPRRSCKRMQAKLSRGQDSSKRIIYQNRSYLMNKTAMGSPLDRTAVVSPFDKSAIVSYAATPFERFPIQTKRVQVKEVKEQFQSTEDENYSQDTVRINLMVNDRRLFSKSFPSFAKTSSITMEFMREMNSSLKLTHYGIVGFDVIPFNHALSSVINEKQTTFNWLLNEGIRQVTLSPLLLSRSIDYDRLEIGDFQIIKFLGSGGFSQVFLAKCKLDQQYCALKFIRKDTITSAKKVKMLQNEKNILFSVKHERLIDLFYAFESNNYIVFGLEYCPHGNLYNYLQKAKLLREEQARQIFLQIIDGVQYLHQHNILFRDIKLENILFDRSGKIKITDFGLSKPEINEHQITYSYCGSPEYMAPEMLAKSGHSYQVDFYALGILLYELLYGRSPFYATKKEDIFLAILNSQPKFPKTPAVSKEVKSLIRGLLAKQPSHRIGSLKGVKELLVHPWLKGVTRQAIQRFSYFSEVKQSQQTKELAAFREIFAAQKSNKHFEKIFFSQSFVNRELFDQLKIRTVKFQKVGSIKTEGKGEWKSDGKADGKSEGKADGKSDGKTDPIKQKNNFMKPKKRQVR